MTDQEDNPNPRPPSAADVNQIFNRIALGLSKHQRIFSTLAKHRPPTSSTTTTTTTAGGGGFSSLTTTTKSPSTTPTPAPTAKADDNLDRERPSTEDDSDLSRAASLPPNAGVGYTTAQSAQSPQQQQADKDTAVLRRKVLGRNAARQLAERDRERERERGKGGGVGDGKAGGKGGGVKGSRGGGDGSESEEEVGRGALVRRKRAAGAEEEVGGGLLAASRRKRARVEGAVGAVASGEVGAGVKGRTDKVEGEGGTELKVDGGGDVVMGDAEVGGEGQKDGPRETSGQERADGEKNKKKRKNKKKKRKAAEGKAEVEV